MIASFFDGRVRIREKALKSPALMDMVQGVLRDQAGVLATSANLRTGSLLVHYDPRRISRETLLDAAQMLERQICLHAAAPAKKGNGAKCARRAETAILAGLYSLTVAGGFVNARFHIAAGVLFTLLAALHVYNRKHLI